MAARMYLVRVALGLSMILPVPCVWSQEEITGISRAVASLGAKSPEARWSSVITLAGLGPDALPYLMRALDNQDEKVRAYAALALGKIGIPAVAAVPRLTSLLTDPNPFVREKGAEALGAMGPTAAQATESLLSCLDDKDPFVSGRSAETLSRLGSAAVPGLVSTLQNGTATARWSATIALAKMGPDAFSAVPALTQALSDTSGVVRWGSAVALGNIGAKAKTAVPALLHALSDRDQDVRREASRAIDCLAPSAVEAYSDWKSVATIIDTLIPRLMSDSHVPGVAIAMINQRSLVWSKCYGIMSTESREPVTHETMFEACSMSKPVFAYLALMLVELGKLNLDKPLIDYLDPACLRGQPDRSCITARMVLSQTSGLPNWRKGGGRTGWTTPCAVHPGINVQLLRGRHVLSSEGCRADRRRALGPPRETNVVYSPGTGAYQLRLG